MLSFASHSPTYRTHTTSDMRKKTQNFIYYYCLFSLLYDEKELNDDAHPLPVDDKNGRRDRNKMATLE